MPFWDVLQQMYNLNKIYEYKRMETKLTHFPLTGLLIFIELYEYKRMETKFTHFPLAGLLIFIKLCIRAVRNVNQFICSGFTRTIGTTDTRSVVQKTEYVDLGSSKTAASYQS